MLAELDLAYTGVTDRIGPNIARLSGLDTLDLSGTDVTDAIIPYIEKLPGLRFVTLSRTKVTPSGVGALRGCESNVVFRLCGCGLWQGSFGSFLSKEVTS
jgi:hypothetical protein